MPSHIGPSKRSVVCLLLLGLIVSHYGNNSLFTAHDYKHVMEFSITPLSKVIDPRTSIFDTSLGRETHFGIL
jgi:hypothetical protein